MKQSEIQEGKTYTNGKDERQVTHISPPDFNLPYGYSRITWATNVGKYGQCYLCTFAKWAKEKVK